MRESLLFANHLVLHFPSVYKRQGVFLLSCACEKFDRRGEWAMVVKAWALHVEEK